MYYISNARHAETTPGVKKFEKLPQTNCKLLSAPTDLLWVKWPTFPIIPNRDSKCESYFKLLTGDPRPTRMVAAISKKAKQLFGQVSTIPAWAASTCLNPAVPAGTEAPQQGNRLTYLPNFQALKSHSTRTINWVMPTQKPGTTLISRVCFRKSTKALAMLFGACPISLQMKRNIFHYLNFHQPSVSTLSASR